MQHRPVVQVVDVISVVVGIVVVVSVTLSKRKTNTILEQTMRHRDGYSSLTNIGPGPGYVISIDCKKNRK